MGNKLTNIQHSRNIINIKQCRVTMKNKNESVTEKRKKKTSVAFT